MDRFRVYVLCGSFENYIRVDGARKASQAMEEVRTRYPSCVVTRCVKCKPGR